MMNETLTAMRNRILQHTLHNLNVYTHLKQSEQRANHIAATPAMAAAAAVGPATPHNVHTDARGTFVW